jgi:hypothetical protein
MIEVGRLRAVSGTENRHPLPAGLGWISDRGRPARTERAARMLIPNPIKKQRGVMKTKLSYANQLLLGSPSTSTAPSHLPVDECCEPISLAAYGATAK